MAGVKIRYVGHKPLKKDTVAGTLTMWPGHGSVAEVPDSVAVKLLQYPTVWQHADKPTMPRPEPAPQPLQPPEDDENDTGEGDNSEVQPPNPDQELREEDKFGFEQPPAGTGPVSVEEIVQALPTLDKDADFTEIGRPKIAKVRALFDGREVAVKALNEAWTKFSAEG